jgi:serine protease Do
LSRTFIAFLLVSLCFRPLDARATDVIADASRYTVQVLTLTEYGFGREARGTSRGAGFLIDRERGWILTNAHVAKKSPSRVRISFRNRTYIAAEKLYIDNHLDLAILQIDPGRIPAEAIAAQLNCSTSPDPGTAVIAYGHPWGLVYTATRGIISGVKTLDGSEHLQTDAAVNPGNSGGPLIEASSGQVVGINSSGLRDSTGLNFAVPLPFACTVRDLLAAGHRPDPPLIPAQLAITRGNQEVVIADVLAPWDTHLRIGDRFVAINGNTAVKNQSAIIDQLRGKQSVSVRVRRDQEILEFTLPVPETLDRVERQGVVFSGLLIGPPVERERGRDQMLIHQVQTASEGEQASVFEGDVVLAVNGIRTNSRDDLLRALEGMEGKEVELAIRRTRRTSDFFQYEYLIRTVEVDRILPIDHRFTRQ